MMKMDADNAIARLGNNRKLYSMLLKKFDGSAMLETLRNELANGSAKGVQDQAHAIKGTASNLSLADLCDKAGAIESALKNGDSGTLNEIDLSEITASVAATAEAIEAWLRENE